MFLQFDFLFWFGQLVPEPGERYLVVFDFVLQEQPQNQNGEYFILGGRKQIKGLGDMLVRLCELGRVQVVLEEKLHEFVQLVFGGEPREVEAQRELVALQLVVLPLFLFFFEGKGLFDQILEKALLEEIVCARVQEKFIDVCKFVLKLFQQALHDVIVVQILVGDYGIVGEKVLDTFLNFRIHIFHLQFRQQSRVNVKIFL